MIGSFFVGSGAGGLWCAVLVLCEVWGACGVLCWCCVRCHVRRWGLCLNNKLSSECMSCVVQLHWFWTIIYDSLFSVK